MITLTVSFILLAAAITAALLLRRGDAAAAERDCVAWKDYAFHLEELLAPYYSNTELDQLWVHRPGNVVRSLRGEVPSE